MSRESFPRTEHEIAYLKWRVRKPDLDELEARLSRPPPMNAKRHERERDEKRRRELKKIAHQAREREMTDSAIRLSRDYKRYVDEWGTRDDWKRDRKSWLRRR